MLLTGIFTGAVLALQSGLTLDQFGARPVVGRLVSASMVKELGPVLTALMLAGRVGSGIAAELGSMVVTDQINALRALGTDPIRKLVVPRVIAGVLMAPILTVISDFMGILGGGIIAIQQLQVPSSVYWKSITDGLYMQDVWMGLAKPFFLGFAIVSIGCHVGLRTTGRHAGRRARDDERRRGCIGDGARAGFLHHAVDDFVVLLTADGNFQTRTAVAEAPKAGPNDPIIVFDHVSLAFDDTVVLRDVSFELRRGHTKIILGASGAGKSISLKLILGLLKPDAGKVWVNGQLINDYTEDQMMKVRADIGMVFQEGALFDSLTVAENVGYKLYEETDQPLDDVRKRVEEVLGFVRLSQFIDRKPSELSGGQRRRVAIARAMTVKPGILLYDEPTTGLDPITSTTIDEEIVKLRDLEEVTSILVTHQLRDAFFVATQEAVKQGDKVEFAHAGPAKMAGGRVHDAEGRHHHFRRDRRRAPRVDRSVHSSVFFVSA